ncbi:hypothetical protein BN949_05246 [Agrobacterium tumefaciens]|nr:hypothetical protein BN949_05246 [Agrobacterium tumefaciens]
MAIPRLIFWAGVMFMAAAVLDSYVNGSSMLGLLFPVGSTLVFFSISQLDKA